MNNISISLEQFMYWYDCTKSYILNYNGRDEKQRYRLLNKAHITEAVALNIENINNNYLKVFVFDVGSQNQKQRRTCILFQISKQDNLKFWDDLFDYFTRNSCMTLCEKIELSLSDPELNKVFYIVNPENEKGIQSEWCNHLV